MLLDAWILRWLVQEKGLHLVRYSLVKLISPMKEVWMGKCYIDLMQLLIIIYICLNNHFAKFVMLQYHNIARKILLLDVKGGPLWTQSQW